MSDIKILKTIAINGNRKTELAEINGQKVVLRRFPPGSSNIEHEINVLHSLKNAGLNIQPMIVLQEISAIAVSFVVGESAGDSFFYSKEFMKSVKPEDLVNKIRSFKNIIPTKTSLNYTKVRAFYDKKIKSIRRHWPFSEFQPKVEFWTESFRKYNLEAIKDKNYLNHNDLNPGNIIYKNDEVVGFIDWEMAKMEGYYRDFASAYYAALFNKTWRNRFYELLTELESKQEQRLFWNQVLFSIIGDIATFSDMMQSGRTEHYKSGKLSKKTLEKYMENNRIMFKEIINNI